MHLNAACVARTSPERSQGALARKSRKCIQTRRPTSIASAKSKPAQSQNPGQIKRRGGGARATQACCKLPRNAILSSLWRSWRILSVLPSRRELRLRLQRPAQAGCRHSDRPVSRRLPGALPRSVGRRRVPSFAGAGADFTDCNYDYANTRTAPGHATLLTGAYTNGHGIMANEWWDPRKRPRSPRPMMTPLKLSVSWAERPDRHPINCSPTQQYEPNQ